VTRLRSLRVGRERICLVDANEAITNVSWALVFVTCFSINRYANAAVVSRSFCHPNSTGPVVVLIVTARYPLGEPPLESGQATARW
jgi:hypothetical protein